MGKATKGTIGGLSLALAGILATVFANEGGYVNHPSDPGGATNHGITEQVARQHGYTGHMRDLKRTCSLPDEVCADRILTRDYVEKPGFMPLVEIEPAVAEEIVDTAVNMGPPRPSRWLQESLNELGAVKVAVDGQVGPGTIRAYTAYRAATGERGCVAMLDRLDARQSAEYDRLVRVNPRLRTFLKGWKAHRIGNVDRAKCKVAA